MHKSKLLMSLIGAALMSCASDLPDEEDPLETSELSVAAVKPGTELKVANQIDWKNAAFQVSTDPRSEYMRSQRVMAELADLSYENDTAVSQGLWDRGFFPIKIIHKDAGLVGKAKLDASLSVSSKQEVIVVAIRGTQGGADWLTDFTLAPNYKATFGSANQTTVHAGFDSYAKVLESELMANPQFAANCSAQMPPEQRIPMWLTGHSLGGAVASIVADRLTLRGCNVRGVSTFGSPKPGFKDFKDQYESLRSPSGRKLLELSSRWTYKDDPVPCIPAGGAWRHVGRRSVISKDGIEFMVQPDDCGDPNAALARLKKSLVLLAPHSAFPPAVQSWLKGDFILEWLCNPNTPIDDIFSLGLCTLHEKTGRLRDAFAMEPHELLGLIFFANKFDDHDEYNYVKGIPADFSYLPPGPPTNVTVRVYGGDRSFTIWDAKTNATCTTERVGDNQECVFPSFVGAPMELHIVTAKSNLSGVNSCGKSEWKTSSEFVCSVTARANGTVPLNQPVF